MDFKLFLLIFMKIQIMKISKDLVNKSGIYCIENIINGKKYIGKSINIYYRLHRHKCDLLKNRHKNPILQNSWNKYGEDNFKNYIIELCELSIINKRESYYIDNMGDMNCAKFIDNRTSYSLETRQKMSIGRKLFFKNGGVSPISKKIDCFDLKGNYIKTFHSIKEASLALNVSKDQIHRNLVGIHKKAKEFQFKFQNSSKVIKEYVKYNYSDIKVKVIVKEENNNNSMFFDSMLECSKYFNVTPAAIRYHIKRKSKFKNKYIIGLVKSCELLETPEEDNQQPSIVEIQ